MFDRGVNEALLRTVNRLEDMHNLAVINNMVFSADSLQWTSAPGASYDSDFDEDKAFFKAHTDTSKNVGAPKKPLQIIRRIDKNDQNAVIEIKVESDSDNQDVQSFSYNIRTTTPKSHAAVVVGNRKRNHVVFSDEQENNKGMIFIRADTLLADADSLYTISAVKIDSILTELDTFKVLRPELSHRIEVKAGNLKRIANKVFSEVTTWDLRKIDEEQLSEVLRTELAESNIPLDFEFGIVRDSVIDFPVPVSDSTALANTRYQASLYPNDIFQKNIRLVVAFPGKTGFIYRSLNWLLVASFFFSAFILVTFALSIYYILRQKKISEMKSDFINNMTHEFKTPIATISVATDSITNAKVLGDPERIKYFAGMIKKENTRMNRQVEDILTIARLDRKEFDFRWEAIDVHELVKDAVQGIVLQIEKRGGKIELDLQAANPVVTTDRNHCTNLLYNLIDNANKYSAEKPQVKISTRNLSKGVQISVEDKGIGMSKTVQAKIFERFYRQTSGNIHNVKGFGLGLSYVKAVLEATHGTISVNSEPGRGSKFDVFLPFVRE